MNWYYIVCFWLACAAIGYPLLRQYLKRFCRNRDSTYTNSDGLFVVALSTIFGPLAACFGVCLLVSNVKIRPPASLRNWLDAECKW